MPWICSLSLWLAWKVTTRRASIGIASPVRGLRPGRGALVRIRKLPKPEILTSLPSTRLAEIHQVRLPQWQDALSICVRRLLTSQQTG